MSNAAKLKEVVKALTKAKIEISDAVNKAVTSVDTARQVQTEQSSRQD